MRPERLWWWTVQAHRSGHPRLARLLKAINFTLNSASLPAQVQLVEPVTLWHRGVGTVIHPSTRIGRGVRIGHNVTVSAGDWQEVTEHAVVIEDGVVLTTGCTIVPRQGRGLTVGAGAIIGAHALITDDVPAGAVMAAPRAVNLKEKNSDITETRA